MLTWDELDKPKGGPLAHYQIIRRNGAVVPFEPSKIAHAMMRAFMAVHGYTDRNAQRQLPFLGCSYLTHQVERRPDLAGMGGWIKQYFLALFKTKARTAKVCAANSTGFFSASKANLRNAP